MGMQLPASDDSRCLRQMKLVAKNALIYQHSRDPEAFKFPLLLSNQMDHESILWKWPLIYSDLECLF